MHAQVLQMTSGPAKLPYSAATMFLLAFLPPLYFRVMHPCINRVLAHTQVRQAEEEEQGVPASSAVGMRQMQCAQHGALKLRTSSIKWEQMELQS